MIMTSLSNAGGMCSIPGQGAKTPPDSQPENKNLYGSIVIKDSMVHIKKIKRKQAEKFADTERNVYSLKVSSEVNRHGR